jgi:hypothetical protein
VESGDWEGPAQEHQRKSAERGRLATDADDDLAVQQAQKLIAALRAGRAGRG